MKLTERTKMIIFIFFSDLILFVMPETPEKMADEANTLKEDVKDKSDDKKDEVKVKVSRDDMEEELDYEPANLAEVGYYYNS